jgi:hypothetical protein
MINDHRSWGSSVSIVSWLQIRQPGFNPQQEQRIFPLASYVQTSSVAHPASCPMDSRILSPGVKCSWGVTLTTQPIWCRGQEWVGDIRPLPCSTCMAVEGQLYFYFRIYYLILFTVHSFCCCCAAEDVCPEFLFFIHNCGYVESKTYLVYWIMKNEKFSKNTEIFRVKGNMHFQKV